MATSNSDIYSGRWDAKGMLTKGDVEIGLLKPGGKN